MRSIGRAAGSLRGPAALAVFLMVLVGGGAGPTLPGGVRGALCCPTHLIAAPVAVRDGGASGIVTLQQRLRAVPADFNAWAALGASYVQEARRSGDPTYYPKAEGALRKSLSLHRDGNNEAMTGLGALAAARHDFAGALQWGKRARAIDPYSSSIYGVMGDALVELGRYKEGFAAMQRMVDLRPGLASYARVSYDLELQGDVAGAVQAMKLAEQAAPTPSDAAFADYYLGELYWNAGRTSDAARAS